MVTFSYICFTDDTLYFAKYSKTAKEFIFKKKNQSILVLSNLRRQLFAD